MNIFKVLDNAIKGLARKNQQYGDIGKDITDNTKKQMLGLNSEESEIYYFIKVNDKNRLLGIYENKQNYIQQNTNWNGVNIDKPQQIL